MTTSRRPDGARISLRANIGCAGWEERSATVTYRRALAVP
jgi:hypothetical protein